MGAVARQRMLSNGTMAVAFVDAPPWPFNAGFGRRESKL
jgi:hypothetical protein